MVTDDLRYRQRGLGRQCQIPDADDVCATPSQRYLQERQYGGVVSQEQPVRPDVSPLPEIVGSATGFARCERSVYSVYIAVEVGYGTVTEGDEEEDDLDADHDAGLDEEPDVVVFAEEVEDSATRQDLVSESKG